MRLFSTGFVALLFAISIALHALFFSDENNQSHILEAEHKVECDWDCHKPERLDRG